MICYKVCKILANGNRVSCLALGDYKLNYEKDKKVSKSNTLGIFVFADIYDALLFSSRYTRDLAGKYGIIQVDCFNIQLSPQIISPCANERDLDKFYAKTLKYTSSPPHGTLCFEYVIPLE